MRHNCLLEYSAKSVKFVQNNWLKSRHLSTVRNTGDFCNRIEVFMELLIYSRLATISSTEYLQIKKSNSKFSNFLSFKISIFVKPNLEFQPTVGLRGSVRPPYKMYYKPFVFFMKNVVKISLSTIKVNHFLTRKLQENLKFEDLFVIFLQVAHFEILYTLIAFWISLLFCIELRTYFYMDL